MLIRGFHLIESLVAIGILSLILVAVFTLMPSSLLAVKKGEVRLRADTLAQSLLERTRTRPFGNLTVNSTAADPPKEIEGVAYLATLGIYEVDGMAVERARLLRVEVTGTYHSQPFVVRQEQVVCNVRR